jgi:preprotein translocase subunit SecA
VSAVELKKRKEVLNEGQRKDGDYIVKDGECIVVDDL